jgi:ribonuclease D
MAESLPEMYVNTPALLAACCEALSQETLIGFDTEFIGEQSYIPQLCLVQIATAKGLYIVDPIRLDDVSPMWKILQDPEKTIIVHAGREEARMARHATSQMPNHFFDLQIAAGLVGMHYPISLSGLVRESLRVRLDKSETLTDWAQRPLSAKQLAYAYDDVRYLIPIYKKMERKLKKLGRQEWLQEEWERFCNKAVRDNKETERWRKLKGVVGLDRRRMAVAREVYHWREDRAAALNRPSRYLLRDDLVLEIAKHVPRTVDDILNFRVHQRDAENILDVIDDAMDLPDAQLPKKEKKEIDLGDNAWIAQLFSGVLNSMCAEEQLHQALVATQTDLKTFIFALLSKKTTGDSLLFHGWRRDMFYETFTKLWAGKLAMRLKPEKRGFSMECVPITADTDEPEEKPAKPTSRATHA